MTDKQIIKFFVDVNDYITVWLAIKMKVRGNNVRSL